MLKNNKIGYSSTFQIIIGYYNRIFVISVVFSRMLFLLFLLLVSLQKDDFFQRVHLYIWGVAGHELSTLSIWARGFNSELISHSFFHRWLNKYTIHWQFMTTHELWNSIIFVNSKTSLVIAPLPTRECHFDALRTKIDMKLTPYVTGSYVTEKIMLWIIRFVNKKIDS